MNSNYTINSKGYSLSFIIPTRNRAGVLNQTVNKILQLCAQYNYDNVEIVVVDGDSSDSTPLVVQNLQKTFGHVKIKYHRSLKREGSPEASNIGVDLASGDIVMWLGDDMEIPDHKVINAILEDFQKYPKVGIVGGRRIELRKLDVDPPFYLKFGDILTKLTGFVFLDIYTQLRYAEFVPAPIACRRSIAVKCRYDKEYTGLGYREETDYQQQVKALGWQILFDPKIHVLHHGQESGGNRDQIFDKRIGWKSRNHTFYLLKFFSGVQLQWYLLVSSTILLVHSGLKLSSVTNGIKKGFSAYHLSRKQNNCK